MQTPALRHTPRPLRSFLPAPGCCSLFRNLLRSLCCPINTRGCTTGGPARCAELQPLLKLLAFPHMAGLESLVTGWRCMGARKVLKHTLPFLSHCIWE